jgi:hypothetical protein
MDEISNTSFEQSQTIDENFDTIPPTKMMDYITDRSVERTWDGKYGDNITLTGESYISEYVMEITEKMESVDVFFDGSAKGLGKTTAINKYIASSIKDNPNLKVIAVSPRIIFSDFFTETLNEKLRWENIDKKMLNYKEIRNKIYIGDEPLLSIQLNSLIRLVNTNNIIPIVDILILDEIKATLRIFGSKTLKDRIQICHLFIQLIKRAKKIIIADADIDQRCLDIICHIFRDSETNTLETRIGSQQTLNEVINSTQTKKIHVSVNIRKNDKNKYHIYGKKGKMFEIIEAKLKSGKKILIPTNSITISKQTQAFITLSFPNIKMLLINSETTREKNIHDLAHDTSKWKDHTINNTTVPGFSVVIFSPSITVGISIDYLYFDCLVAFFVTGSCCATECAQMLSRCRNLIDNECHIYLPKTSNELYEVSKENLSDQIKKKYVDIIQKIEEVNTTSNSGWENNNVIVPIYQTLLQFMQSVFVHIEMENMLEFRLSLGAFKQEVLKTIQKTVVNDSQIKIFDNILTKKLKYKMKEIKLFVKNYDTEMIFDATDIDLETLVVLKKKPFQTFEESASIKRHYFKELYHIQTPTKEFIFKWFTRGQQVDAFMHCFVSSDQDLKTNTARFLEFQKDEHILFMTFIEDHKQKLFEILKLFNFNPKEPWKFTFNTTKNVERNNKINAILKNIIYKTKKIFLPSEITSNYKLIQKILVFFGLSLKERKSEFTIDIISLTDMYTIIGNASTKTNELSFARNQLQNMITFFESNEVQ